MFKFITKKYEEKIKKMEYQIKNMTWEWNKEKELYDDDMQKKVYEQKVDFVIGGMDMRKHKEVHRPICGLTNIDAYRIADMVKHNLDEQGIMSQTSFHWRKREECFVIDVQVLSIES